MDVDERHVDVERSALKVFSEGVPLVCVCVLGVVLGVGSFMGH